MGKQRLQFTGSYMNNTAKWMRSHSHVLSVLSLSRNESVNRDQPIPIVRSDRSTWPLRSESGIWIRFVHVPRHRVYIARGHGGVDPLGMPHEGSEQKASLPHFLNQMASSDPTLITRSYEFCLLLTNLKGQHETQHYLNRFHEPSSPCGKFDSLLLHPMIPCWLCAQESLSTFE